ncbi:hypothetical protein C8K36_1011352 [Rhodococcus sp. OK519]|uniref:hypothetical protein n=1 Tax=Rhodococcus sp. OK519 TaxID=2135729 RepID=UPI000D3B2691|nr:hypothetical protein C8K36_1011352 [Rhodococcus sp. OK519]
MSAITDYFSAPSDAAAAAALDGLIDLDPEDIASAAELYRTSPDEAAVPRVRIAASGTPVLQAKGIDPTVALGRLESALTDRSYEDVAAGPRRGSMVADSDSGDSFVLSVADELRDALAGSDPRALVTAARNWIFDEAAGPSEESVPFVSALAALASTAVSRGDRLYCRIIV